MENTDSKLPGRCRSSM